MATEEQKDVVGRVAAWPASAVKDAAELAAKAFVAILALAYATGLIIINFHLQSYGLASLGFARPDYVAAGLLWLVSTGVGFAAVRLLMWAGRGLAKARTGHAWLSALLRSIVALLTMIGMLGAYVDSVSGTLLQRPSAKLYLACGVVLLLPLPAMLIVWLLRRAYEHRYSETLRDLPELQTFVAAGLLMLGTVALYSEIVYPLFLPVYGGGRMSRVVIVPTSGTLSFAGRPLNSSPAYLVAETDQWIAITDTDHLAAPLFSSRRAIRIKRDLVAAIELQ